MSKEDLSIIIPAYNEGRVLKRNLESLLKVFASAQIILVDDGSTDKTGEVAKKFYSQIKYIKLARNKGKGRAIKRGMLEATGNICLFVDADLPFGVEGMEKVVKELKSGDAQIVIVEKRNYKKGVLYLLGRSFVRKIISLLFGFPFVDTQAGLKGFTRQASTYIFANTAIDRFACDIEILYLARKGDFSVKTVPLKVNVDAKRLSHFKLMGGILFLLDIFKIRLSKYKAVSRDRVTKAGIDEGIEKDLDAESGL